MKNTQPSTSASKQMCYGLVHRITRKPIYTQPPTFRYMSEAIWYALQHDLHADPVRVTIDLVGKAVPE